MLSAVRSAFIAAAALAFLAAPAAVLAAPAHWTVDKSVSTLGFKSSYGGADFQGGFADWDASIDFDPSDLADSRVVVNVDVASASTGDPSKDQQIPSSDWFNAPKFPKATFQATSFKDLGGGHYQAIGTLSMKGVSMPFTLPFTLAISGDDARMTSQTTIDRHAFKVGEGEYDSADSVPYEVEIDISLAAHKAK